MGCWLGSAVTPRIGPRAGTDIPLTPDQSADFSDANGMVSLTVNTLVSSMMVVVS
jgi:hypothetical protein